MDEFITQNIDLSTVTAPLSDSKVTALSRQSRIFRKFAMISLSASIVAAAISLLIYSSLAGISPTPFFLAAVTAAIAMYVAKSLSDRTDVKLASLSTDDIGELKLLTEKHPEIRALVGGWLNAGLTIRKPQLQQLKDASMMWRAGDDFRSKQAAANEMLAQLAASATTNPDACMTTDPDHSVSIDAFERTYASSAQDPSMAERLAIWQSAWRAAMASVGVNQLK